MGLIGNFLRMLFGDGRNVIAETVQVFRENTEAGAIRDAEINQQVIAQFGREFGLQRRGAFDTVMDAINRLPRPAMALGTLALFISAMVDPVWFSERMRGIALVPEPLWWLLGAIVSFYFGARHQLKNQQFQSAVAAAVAVSPQAVEAVGSLRGRTEDTPGVAQTGTDAGLTIGMVEPARNSALEDWRQGLRGMQGDR